MPILETQLNSSSFWNTENVGVIYRVAGKVLIELEVSMNVTEVDGILKNLGFTL